MKKMYLMTILVCTLLNGCVPNLVVDTKGRSGTFDYSRFAVAKYIELGTVGLIKANELKSKKINRECLKNRGHSVLD